MHVCTCLAGAPAAVSTPGASKKFAKAASALWKAMAIDTDDPLGGGNGRSDDVERRKKKKKPSSPPSAPPHHHPPTAEVDVPPLYRRAVEVDPGPEDPASSRPKTFDRDAAYAELFEARRRASEGAREAAEAAAAAGIADYALPAGVELPAHSPVIPRPDPEYASRADSVLRAAAAARQAIEQRRAAARRLLSAPRVLLCPSDVPAATAAGAQVEVLWPDDGQWWAARVQSGSADGGGGGGGKETGGDHLLYGTGEQERGVDLRAMAEAGEIAWSGPERARCLVLHKERLLEAERERKARRAERAAAKKLAQQQRATLEAAERAQAERAAALQLSLQRHQELKRQEEEEQMRQRQQQYQGQQMQQQQQALHQTQQQQHQQLIAVRALVAAGAATRGARVSVRLAATGQILRGSVLGPVHGGSGLGVQLEGGGGGGGGGPGGAEAGRAVELRVERDGVDFHVFLELGG